MARKTPLDIHSKGEYPADALSNFFGYDFVFDETQCASMEGFLQSLKVSDRDLQIKICSLKGKAAKEAGLEYDWRESQILYWREREYHRHSCEYQELITRAYDAMFKNSDYQKGLADSRVYELDHSIGLNNPNETILTTNEFLGQIKRLQLRLSTNAMSARACSDEGA